MSNPLFLEDGMTPPPWLNEHPAVKRLNVRFDLPVLPGTIYRTHPRLSKVQWIVKILGPNAQEADIYDVLHKLEPADPNHTLPCDVVRSSSWPTLLIMPCLSRLTSSKADFWDLLGIYWQILEGLHFLHSHKIAHMDIAADNIVSANPQEAARYSNVSANKVYILDYGSSLLLEHEPGKQAPVALGPAQMRMCYDPDRFDPYSWDMYCMGSLFSGLTKSLYEGWRPWFLYRYIQWVKGEECGCTTICHCRPTARRAKQVLLALRLVLGVWYIPKRALRAVLVYFWPSPRDSHSIVI